MQLGLRKAFAIFITLLCPAFVAGQDYATAQKSFLNEMKVIRDNHLKSVQQIGEQYRQNLNTFAQTSQDDNFVTTAHKLMMQFDESSKIAPTEETSIPALMRICSTAADHLSQLKRHTSTKVVQSVTKYEEVLKRLQNERKAEGNPALADKLEEERAELRKANIVVAARTILGSPVVGPFAPKARAVLPKMFGRFYVSVDDSAIIYVNGNLVHRAPLNESISSSIELEIGDCIVVKLVNAISERRFMMAFLTNDQSTIVEFRASDFRILPAVKDLNISDAEFQAIKEHAIRDSTIQRQYISAQVESEWLWGHDNTSWLVTRVHRGMVRDNPIK